jgi:multiple antibiotic resistance protein
MEMTLMGALKTLLHETVGLVTIFNPAAAAAIMLSSSPGVRKSDTAAIAKKTALTVCIASLLTVLTGSFVFRLFGINSASIMVIGGIVLLMMALSMLQGKISETSHSPEESEATAAKEEISVVPLGIPVLFGPGAVSTLMVFHAADKALPGTALLIGAVLLSVTAVYFVLKYADMLLDALGVHGMKIMTRVMGLIVGAIAVQFVIRGTKILWGTL